MEFNIGIIIISLFGLAVYFLIAFNLIVYWIMETWNKDVSVKTKTDPTSRKWLVFSKFCCLIWPIGVPLLISVGVIWLVLFDFGDE